MRRFLRIKIAGCRVVMRDSIQSGGSPPATSSSAIRKLSAEGVRRRGSKGGSEEGRTRENKTEGQVHARVSPGSIKS